MNKIILVALVVLLILVGSIYFFDLYDDDFQETNLEAQITEEGDEESEEKENESVSTAELIDCLEEKKMVIYGSRTCPACGQLAESLGGYDKIEQIYVECSDDWDRCEEEKVAGYVPEIQIDGELYEESRDLTSLARETGCSY